MDFPPSDGWIVVAGPVQPPLAFFVLHVTNHATHKGLI